jgi:hypothetical protein
MCGCDGSVTSGEVSVDHVVRSAGIAADLHTVIARVGAIRHDGIVCRAAASGSRPAVSPIVLAVT